MSPPSICSPLGPSSLSMDLSNRPQGHPKERQACGGPHRSSMREGVQGFPTHLLTAKSRISAECPRYSLIIFPERASQSRTAPSRLQVYTTAELSSHSNCTIPDCGRGRPQGEDWGPQQGSAPPMGSPSVVWIGGPAPRAGLWGTSSVQGLWLPLGKPRGLREKHKLGTGPRKGPGLQGRSWLGPKSNPQAKGGGGRAVPHVGTYASSSVLRDHR